MYKEYPVHVTVTGIFVGHDGHFVWIQLGGCGASDSHLLPHYNTICTEYVQKMYMNKLVRLTGTRAWEDATNKWGYNWRLCPVQIHELGMEDAPESIKAMCVPNC